MLGLYFPYLHIQILQNTESRPLVFLLISPVLQLSGIQRKGGTGRVILFCGGCLWGGSADDLPEVVGSSYCWENLE